MGLVPRRKSVSEAFLDAWQAMDGDRMHGTSIVIWLGSSMVGLRLVTNEGSGEVEQERIGAS